MACQPPGFQPSARSRSELSHQGSPCGAGTRPRDSLRESVRDSEAKYACHGLLRQGSVVEDRVDIGIEERLAAHCVRCRHPSTAR